MSCYIIKFSCSAVPNHLSIPFQQKVNPSNLLKIKISFPRWFQLSLHVEYRPFSELILKRRLRVLSWFLAARFPLCCGRRELLSKLRSQLEVATSFSSNYGVCHFRCGVLFAANVTQLSLNPITPCSQLLPPHTDSGTFKFESKIHSRENFHLFT